MHDNPHSLIKSFKKYTQHEIKNTSDTETILKKDALNIIYKYIDTIEQCIYNSYFNLIPVSIKGESLDIGDYSTTLYEIEDIYVIQILSEVTQQEMSIIAEQLGDLKDKGKFGDKDIMLMPYDIKLIKLALEKDIIDKEREV